MGYSNSFWLLWITAAIIIANCWISLLTLLRNSLKLAKKFNLVSYVTVPEKGIAPLKHSYKQFFLSNYSVIDNLDRRIITTTVILIDSAWRECFPPIVVWGASPVPLEDNFDQFYTNVHAFVCCSLSTMLVIN